jgi:hypothetical protein
MTEKYNRKYDRIMEDENEKRKAYQGCGIAMICLILLSVGINIFLLTRPEPESRVVVERDTLWRDTTIYKPAAADSQQTGEIVYIRIPYPVSEPGDTVHDSIQVPIPIEQKRYDDSLYTAWVSGYRPALDSICLHQPEIVTTITETIVKPAPRWSIGLSVGPGVSIDRQRHMGIYAGFTATYRLWPK